LKFAQLKVRKEVVAAHILPYSTLRGSYTRGKIEYEVNDIHHMSRDEVKFITLTHYNRMLDTVYASVRDLIYDPPPFEREVYLRSALGLGAYDLSTIVVTEEIPLNKIELLIESRTYEDVRERLIILSQ